MTKFQLFFSSMKKYLNVAIRFDYVSSLLLFSGRRRCAKDNRVTVRVAHLVFHF